jgi:ABC-type transporter Mla maintaining outer membrane lipid asymmetry permease subunit MlaE
MALAAQRSANSSAPSVTQSRMQRVGRRSVVIINEVHALLQFVGECGVRAITQIIHPRLFRWRAVLRTIQISGFAALPIIGLTSLLLGVVIAYQGADQLRHYGANIFVVDLIGYSMLREFAPLISAIIIAGRSGSAYAAQIGTMPVTEEVDAMRTIGIEPIDVLVLPKLMGLTLALPLLTVIAGMGIASAFHCNLTDKPMGATMLVSDVMTADVTVASPHDSVQHAAALMQQYDFGALLVGDQALLLGMVTDRDIAIRAVALGRTPGECLVNQVMSSPLIYVRGDDTIETAAHLMAEHKIRRLAVVNDEQRLVGIVSLGDVALRVVRPAGEALGSICEPVSPLTGAAGC